MQMRSTKAGSSGSNWPVGTQDSSLRNSRCLLRSGGALCGSAMRARRVCYAVVVRAVDRTIFFVVGAEAKVWSARITDRPTALMLFHFEKLEHLGHRCVLHRLSPPLRTRFQLCERRSVPRWPQIWPTRCFAYRVRQRGRSDRSDSRLAMLEPVGLGDAVHLADHGIAAEPQLVADLACA